MVAALSIAEEAAADRWNLPGVAAAAAAAAAESICGDMRGRRLLISWALRRNAARKGDSCPCLLCDSCAT